jgi:lipoprotein-anchoring transpeptidase ErfK/SrfK
MDGEPAIRQATIPEEYRRHIVQYERKEAPGTMVIDTGNKFLYYVLPKSQAIRYGITVGEAGQDWSGIASVGRKEEMASWTPTAGRVTQYRIHGTNQPEYIGRAISSGCIRDKRGRDRPLQSRQNRHDCRCAPGKSLDIRTHCGRTPRRLSPRRPR